jgi:hypothetical protein
VQGTTECGTREMLYFLGGLCQDGTVLMLGCLLNEGDCTPAGIVKLVNSIGVEEILLGKTKSDVRSEHVGCPSHTNKILTFDLNVQ